MQSKSESKQRSRISDIQHVAVKRVIGFLKRGSDRKVTLKKGKRTLVEVPLAVGLGSATAAILMNSTLTAIAALVALSNDVKIEVSHNNNQTH